MPTAAKLLGGRCLCCRSRGGPLCIACRASLPRAGGGATPPGIDRAIVPFRYAGAARSLILRLKVTGLTDATAPLVEACVAEVRCRGIAADLVTWVPCRKGDRRRRGFDHAEVIARGVAAGLGLEARKLLTRVGRQPDQVGLPAGRRVTNVRRAFHAAWAPPRVVLVDDLVTTGATAAECGRALRVAGARSVELVACCRA